MITHLNREFIGHHLESGNNGQFVGPIRQAGFKLLYYTEETVQFHLRGLGRKLTRLVFAAKYSVVNAILIATILPGPGQRYKSYMCFCCPGMPEQGEYQNFMYFYYVQT